MPDTLSYLNDGFWMDVDNDPDTYVARRYGFGACAGTTQARFSNAEVVGMFSLDCSVRLHWKYLLEFMERLRTDQRYLANPEFRFSVTYLEGGKVWGMPV